MAHHSSPRAKARAFVIVGALFCALLLVMAPATFAAPVTPYSDGATLSVVEKKTGATMMAPEELGAAGSGVADAGVWLQTQQNTAGWFPWTPGGGATANTQGPSARGLLKAYQHSGAAGFKTGAVLSGDYLVPVYPRTYTDGDPRFATHDPLFLVELSLLTGDTKYAGFVQANFWGKLTAGTYGETNDMDAAEYGASVVTARAGQGIVELSPWDLSATAIAAHVAGENNVRDALMGQILAGLDQTTATDTDYDVSGLAGAVWAAGVTGVNLDPTAGVHAASNSTADLAAELLTFGHQADGSWLWGTVADPNDQTNHDVQATAFAIMALDAVNPASYARDVARGAAFIRAQQDAAGQILPYPTAASTTQGGVEVHAEALAALVAVAPSVVYVDDSWIGTTAGTDPDGAGPALAYGYDAFSTIPEGLDAVATGGTVNIAAGTYDVAETMVLSRAVTISGPTGGGARVIAATGFLNVFDIRSSNATIQNLEITAASAGTFNNPPDNELNTSLIKITTGTGMTGISITGNTLYVPAQSGAMSTWNARAITAGSGTVSGLSITGNTIYNTRNGVVIHYNNLVTISNNMIYNTKGGIMNYTGSQADAANRTMSGNAWGTVHNEWDIVWNSGGGPYQPDYHQSVLMLSGANNGAYVLSLMTTGTLSTLTGNRSHIFVNAGTGTNAVHPANGNQNVPYATLALGMDAVVPGGTIYVAGSGAYTVPAGTHGGGLVVTGNDATINLNGATVGVGSPAFTIAADDVTIMGPGTLDGNHTDPAVLVQAGADNFTLQEVEVKNWEDGVQVAGAVTSLKIVNNYIHNNDDAGLQVDAGATLSGVVTVEGNLFKSNGGNGIESAVELEAEYNSWGAVGGPATGDGVSTSVDADPWTFAETYIDVDTLTDGDQFGLAVNESTSFAVKVMVEARNLYGYAFKLAYDDSKLLKNSVTPTPPSGYACLALTGLAANEVGYQCVATNVPPAPWDGGAVLTIDFTATGAGLTGDGPWTALFDVDHVASTAGTANGAKVYLNNVYGAASVEPDRNITDANDGEITITGIAQYTGFIDVQGRADDSGAVLEVHLTSAAGSVVMATATSAKGGAYTTAYASGKLLTVDSTYYFVVDKPLYLKTEIASDAYVPFKELTTRPLTTLSQLVLKGGDANDNEAIDINDAGCIGGAYGSTPGLCGGAGSTDVNGDGKVDILDLTLMGGNYGLTHSAWTP